MLLRLGPLRPVLGATLFAALHADRVERAADDVVADTGQVLHAAAPDEHQRVLLQVVADARNVSRHFDAVGQTHARHFSERRVRFLRRLSEDADADTPFLRAVLQGRTLRLADDFLATLSDELTD